MTSVVQRPAAASVLPAELVEQADRLADGLAAVLSVNEVDGRDTAAVLGDLSVACTRLVATSWRRSGRLATDGAAPPVAGVTTSHRLVATTVDAAGRVHAGNEAGVLSLVRRVHPDARIVAGLLTWSCGAWREVAVPGYDFVVETPAGWRAIDPGNQES